jgi:HEPN domain-containing protein
MDLRELITADVARTEIEQAEILLDGGFERAAGSVAGVALELHLKTLCDVNGVSYPPKPTIETLVQALYKDKKIDITELKQIQYLGSIRNKCSHPEPVSAKEVQSLIDGVKKLV